MSKFVPYSLPLHAASGPWIYAPLRDASPEVGWNASYTGNTTWPLWQVDSSQGAGSLFFRTRAQQASVTLDFTGTGLTLCLSSSDTTPYRLVIDDAPLPASSSAASSASDPCAEFGSSTTTVTSGTLPNGPHRAVLGVAGPVEGTDADELRFFGGVVAMEVPVATEENQVHETIIDDQQSEWVLNPGRGKNAWDMSSPQSAFANSATFMCFYRPDATASYAFKGASAAVLYGYNGADTHSYTIQLTSPSLQQPITFAADASGSGWDVGPSPLFVSPTLDPTQEYNLTLANYDGGAPNCPNEGYHIRDFRSCCVQFDKLVLLGSEKLLTAPETTATFGAPSTSSTPTPGAAAQQSNGAVKSGPGAGVIAGAVIAGLVGVLALCLLAFLLFRRHRRKRWEADNTPAPGFAGSIYGMDSQYNSMSGAAGPAVMVGGAWDSTVRSTSTSTRPSTGPAVSGGSGVSSNQPTIQPQPYGNGASGIGYAPRPTAAGATSSGKRPLPSGEKAGLASSASSRTGKSTPKPLPPAEMERVLQFVSVRMNLDGAPPSAPAVPTKDGAALPAYRNRG